MNNPKIIKVVDLGFAMARVKREQMASGVYTTLTLVTPSDSSDGFYDPAASAQAYMSPQQLKDLMGALTAEPIE